MSITLNIERIVLDGAPLNRLQERALRASLETHLAGLLVQSAQRLDRGYAVPLVNAPESGVPTTGDPSGAGRAIAQSIHSALSPPAS